MHRLNSACRIVHATVQDELHSPPAKRTCVRPPLSELSLNFHFNHLKVEAEQDKQTHCVAEVKEKNA